jgi:hypothetical protein
MKNAPASQPVSATIDGHPALQDELTGTEKGTNVVFLHTTVDDDDHFQQILAWTLKSRWQKQNNCCAKSPRVSGVKITSSTISLPLPIHV